MITVKMSGAVYEAIKKEIERYAPKETMMFARAKRIQHGEDEIYLVPSLFILGEQEAVRSATAVWPCDEFQQRLYKSMKEEGLGNGYRVVTMHSHPFQEKAGFSGVDWDAMEEDKEIYKVNYDGFEFMWIVFSRNSESFEGCVVKPNGYKKVDRLFVYGTKLTVLNETDAGKITGFRRDLYSRMVVIPKWDQDFVSNLKVAVVGLGGLGSNIVETLIMLGIGDDSELVLIDHDTIEVSNLSRIPYARRRDIGKPKVEVATRYVRQARPSRKVVGIKEPCYSEKAQQALSGCHFMIACLDNDLGRGSMNYAAGSFMVPLLDLASGVLIDDFEGQRVTTSSGHARLFIPGSTPCLLCNMGLDHKDFDREILKLKMNEKEKALLEKTGYIQDFVGEGTPEPSVYSLNACVANIGTTFLCTYLLGNPLDYHGLHYTMETMQIEKLRAESMPFCPVCGNEGVIGRGEMFDIESVAGAKQLPSPKPKGR